MSADFIDSNVLIYAFDESNEQKSRVSRSIVQRALELGDAEISFQVVQEVLNVITSKLSVPATPEGAVRFLNEVLQPLWNSMPSALVYRRAIELRSRYGFAFYDSLIVASALAAGCDRLITEDFQHGQRIEGVTIHNPFL